MILDGGFPFVGGHRGGDGGSMAREGYRLADPGRVGCYGVYLCDRERAYECKLDCIGTGTRGVCLGGDRNVVRRPCKEAECSEGIPLARVLELVDGDALRSTRVIDQDRYRGAPAGRGGPPQGNIVITALRGREFPGKCCPVTAPDRAGFVIVRCGGSSPSTCP